MQEFIHLSACVADLKCRARQRIPRLAFDYIEEGCNAGNAHGEAGATHTIDLLLAELEQLMSQLHCSDPSRMREHLIGKHELA